MGGGWLCVTKWGLIYNDKYSWLVCFNPFQLSRYELSTFNERYSFLSQMAKQWKEIALVLRDRQFDEDEDPEIDIFDVQVRKRPKIVNQDSS